MDVYIAVENIGEYGYEILWATTDIKEIADYMKKHQYQSVVLCDNDESFESVTFSDFVGAVDSTSSWIRSVVKDNYKTLYEYLIDDLKLEIKRVEKEKELKKIKEQEDKYNKYLKLKEEFEGIV
jgi:hypothetical protein